MASFELAQDKCCKCGACVRDCAFKALSESSTGYPELSHPERCMDCQHCLAICPKGAVSFKGKTPADSLPVKDLELPSAESVSNWLRTRRSMRGFQMKDVERATLESIIATLSNVPTGCNAHGLKFTCLSTRNAMDEFKKSFLEVIATHRDGNKMLPRWLAVPAIELRNGKRDMFFRNAAGMLVISCDKTNPRVVTPVEDVIAACAYFDVLAQAHGLGTCWCGFLKLVQNEVPELLEKTLGISRDTPFYAMLFGYPSVAYARGVQRDDDMTVEWLQ